MKFLMRTTSLAALALVAAGCTTAPPEAIAPGQSASGFVLTHREGGLKFVRAGFVGHSQRFEFRFVVRLAGELYAAQKIDFDALPPASEDVDLAGLRARLEELACCTSNEAGNRAGDPLNLVVIGNGADAIFPFIERGWRLDEPLDIHSIMRTVGAFIFGGINNGLDLRHVAAWGSGPLRTAH